MHLWLDNEYDRLHPELVDAQRLVVAEFAEETHSSDGGRWHRPSWPSGLFMRSPRQWGLRGDPYLWFELSETLRLLEQPADSAQFRRYVEVSLAHLVRDDLLGSTEEMIRVDRYPLAGISGGLVCPPKWQADLAPQLIERFDQRSRNRVAKS